MPTPLTECARGQPATFEIESSDASWQATQPERITYHANVRLPSAGNEEKGVSKKDMQAGRVRMRMPPYSHAAHRAWLPTWRQRLRYACRVPGLDRRPTCAMARYSLGYRNRVQPDHLHLDWLSRLAHRVRAVLCHDRAQRPCGDRVCVTRTRPHRYIWSEHARRRGSSPEEKAE